MDWRVATVAGTTGGLIVAVVTFAMTFKEYRDWNNLFTSRTPKLGWNYFFDPGPDVVAAVTRMLLGAGTGWALHGGITNVAAAITAGTAAPALFAYRGAVRSRITLTKLRNQTPIDVYSRRFGYTFVQRCWASLTVYRLPPNYREMLHPYAQLPGATLHDLKDVDLSYANLVGAQLLCAEARHLKLVGADLHYANLYSAELTSADLNSAKLLGAELHHANLAGSNLTFADFSGANLRGVNFSEPQEAGRRVGMLSELKRMSEEEIAAEEILNATVEGAVLKYADFTNACLAATWLHRATLHETKLGGADLGNAKLPPLDRMVSVHWTDKTQWDPHDAAEILARSIECHPGYYILNPTDERRKELARREMERN